MTLGGWKQPGAEQLVLSFTSLFILQSEASTMMWNGYL